MDLAFSTLFTVNFFPRRDMDLDLERTHLFNTFIDIIGGAMLSEVTMFHETLCRKVDSLEHPRRKTLVSRNA